MRCIPAIFIGAGLFGGITGTVRERIFHLVAFIFCIHAMQVRFYCYVIEKFFFSLFTYLINPFVQGGMVSDVVDDAVMILDWKTSHIKSAI